MTATVNLKEMRPMQMHRYITSNHHECPRCKKTKRLSRFWNKEHKEISNICNECTKKEYELEVMRIVLGVYNEVKEK